MQNRSNTQCIVVLLSKRSQNLLRILAIQYEIPASIAHAVKGFLVSGPYKALGVKCFAPQTVKQEFDTAGGGPESVFSLFFFVQNLSSLVMEPGSNDTCT